MIHIHGEFSSVLDAAPPLSVRVGAKSAAGLAGQGLGAVRLCCFRQDVCVCVRGLGVPLQLPHRWVLFPKNYTTAHT